MANYVTTNYIINTVYGLLSSISTPKYKNEKPTAIRVNEYIVINALPIPADAMQKCFFNVNYHVKNIAEGVPDVVKIQAGELAVMNILEKVTGSNYMIDLEQQSNIPEPSLGETFSNMRFSFKHINK